MTKKDETGRRAVTVVRSKRREAARARRTGEAPRESDAGQAVPQTDPGTVTLMPAREATAPAKAARKGATKRPKK